MIDKLSNINAGNGQKKGVSETSKVKDNSQKTITNLQDNSNKNVTNVQISAELYTKDMSAEAPIDTNKISVIKNAIARGDYPMDYEKVADALLKAYKDIK